MSDCSAIECIQFSNGRDALDYLVTTQNFPGMIFTDLDMHLMSGEEFIIELKKDEITKEIPVYIYTTSFMLEYAGENIKENVAGIVIKTTNLDNLKRSLNEILQG